MVSVMVVADQLEAASSRRISSESPARPLGRTSSASVDWQVVDT